MAGSIENRSAWLLAAGALVLVLALSPARAQAQQDEFHYSNFNYDYGLFAAVGLASIAGVGFLVTDFVYAAQGSWVPPLAAGLELVLAGLPWLVIGGVFAIDADDADAAAAAFMFGAGFSAHAIASFALYDASPDPPRERAPTASGRERSGLHVAPWLGPRQAGASVFSRF